MKLVLLITLILPGTAIAAAPKYECRVIREMSMTEKDCTGANVKCDTVVEDEYTTYSMENKKLKVELIYLKGFPMRIFLTDKASGYYAMAPAAADYATVTLGGKKTAHEVRCWMQ